MKNDKPSALRLTWEEWKGYLSEFYKGMPAIGLKSRLIINIEQFKLLEKSKPFNNDVDVIKAKLNIPKLNPAKDQLDIDDPERSFSVSKWLETKNTDWINKFDIELNALLNKYKLPMDYYEWLRWVVLYGYTKYSSINVMFSNYEALHRIIETPQELSRIGLTTEEKRFYKFVARKVLDIKRRPAKQISLAYDEFLSALQNSKNTIRKARASRNKKLLNNLNKIGNKQSYYDPTSGKTRQERITSSSAAFEIYEDEDNPNVLKKKAATLRKIKQRLKVREARLIGNN